MILIDVTYFVRNAITYINYSEINLDYPPTYTNFMNSEK